MNDLKFVVRFFKNAQYLYSVHCDQAILDDLVSKAKEDGLSVKVVAYKADDELLNNK